MLKELRALGNEIPVIMITAYGSVERAVDAMRAGAYDFITRPFEPDHIALVVKKALERHRLQRESRCLPRRRDSAIDWLWATVRK